MGGRLTYWGVRRATEPLSNHIVPQVGFHRTGVVVGPSLKRVVYTREKHVLLLMLFQVPLRASPSNDHQG